MKARFLALAALVLGLASCQTEPEGLDVNVSGEVDTFVTVAIPDVDTRANSAESGIKNLVNAADSEINYTIRYIFEVYYGDNGVQKQVYYTDGQSASFPVRLVPGRDYNFVAWADIVEQPADEKMNKALPYDGNTTDVHYDTTNLKAITLLDEWNAMDETRDAYTGFHNTADPENEKYTGSSSINIQMTRPFAKLRVITTDMVELNNLGIRPVSANVTYSAFSHESFNALNGTYSDETIEKTHTYAIADYADHTGANKVLFTDYFFADDNDVVKFQLDVFEKGVTEQNETTRIKLNDFNTDIPIKRNYLTTISGNILTDGNNVKVDVWQNGAFAGEIEEKFIEVFNGFDLQTAINAAIDGVETTITLGGNIEITNPLTRAESNYGITIPGNKVIVLNLNGKTISQTKAQSGKYALIENNGTLTICNGTISYGDNATLTADVGYASNTIQNNGDLTINDGVTILNTSGQGVATYGYPHVIDTNGKLTINGGVLTNQANYSTMRIWTSNTNAEKCNVTINGGTFNGCIDFQAHNNNNATIPHYGVLTVNGGTFNADSFTNSTIRVLRFAVNANDMHATINNGYFNGKVWVRNIGTFESTPKIFDIYGGTFTAAAKEGTDTNLLASGYGFVEGENNTYRVDCLGYYTDANGNYHITGAKGWLWMADQNDTFFRNKTIYLDNDIDFTGVDMRVTRMWTPEYSATFDGQNHTVSNIWMASNYSSDNQALFDGLMTVKNLKVDRASVFGMSQVGIIGANIFGSIENCHVNNSRSYGYVHHVGGIVGLHSWGEIKNCSIEHTSIECYYYGAVGAIAGAMNEVSRNITGCTVKDCRLIKEGPEGVYPDWDPLFGIAVGYAYAPGTYVFNVEVENNTIKGVASEQMYGEVAAGSTITVNGVQP